MIELVSASNPRFLSESHDVVILTVRFAHLGEPVEFAATAYDTEPHGRAIHARTLAGEFGPVAEFIPPTPAEIAARDNPIKRQRELAHASAQAQHWDMMGDPEQATAWRSYYREIYALEQAPGWPLVEQWPEAPQ